MICNSVREEFSRKKKSMGLSTLAHIVYIIQMEIMHLKLETLLLILLSVTKEYHELFVIFELRPYSLMSNFYTEMSVNSDIFVFQRPFATITVGVLQEVAT